MKKATFCHLHLHSAYSLLDSTLKIKEAVAKSAELGMNYLALTDHAVLHGAVEFYQAAQAAGIKPIIGCDVYVARNGMAERKTQRDNMSLVLLAETQVGYQNLVKLVSIAHLEGMYYRPRIDKELLRAHAEGLIGLSGNLRGEVNEACREQRLEDAEALAREYQEILGEDNFFLELMDHGEEDEKKTNQALIALSEKTGIPTVATNDVHYIHQSDAAAHDVLTCLQRGSLVADPSRYRYPGDQFYLKSAEEMHALFAHHPEAIENTMDIAKRCNVEFFFPDQAEDLHFPKFPLPDGYAKEVDYLIALGKEGLSELYAIEDLDQPKNPREQEISERFYYEVSVIEKTNYINYFLVVADFISYARSVGIPVGPGRGSGAGSLLAYSLKITTVDPLAYGLIFERFLNPDRVSPPDFDIDFCPTRRQEVIRYVREKYGEACVAQIITFGSLGAKTLMRDLGRVLEIGLPYCDRLAKLIPETPGMTLQKALQESPEFKQAVETEPDAKKIMQYAPLLEGLPRHTGMHAAGVVIGEKPLIEIIPLTREPKEQLTVVQFEKDPTEKIGLLKMDFLGLKNLTVIHEACALIKQNHGITIDPERLPLDDPKVYELLAKGDTIGIFQLESSGMRETLRQVAPDCIQDVIAILALYRPGPMQFIPDFTRRKHGKEEVAYDHPLLEPILKETYGIIVYQEQIQQAAQTLAGFSLGQGDLLRRAMGKKKPEVMAAQREKFVEGCEQTHAIEKKLAGTIFDNIERFAQYGFNKSHSTAYGLITYQTAWLKAHYPGEFMAALLSGEMSNTDKLANFIAETSEVNIDMLPPCVNTSIGRFNAAGDGAIRFGLTAIKGVGEGLVDEIIKERAAEGPFKGMMDFCVRLRSPNRKMMESLVRSGSFDFSGIHRARLYQGIDLALSRAHELSKDRQGGQTSMFDLMQADHAEENSDEELPDCPCWTESELLAAERELIGFYLSGHPLTRFRWMIDHFSLDTPSTLADRLHGDLTRMAGMITEVRKLYTRKDQKPMASFRIESLQGSVEAIMFPEAFEAHGSLVDDDALLMFGGRLLEEENAEQKLQILELHPLEDAARLFAERISIHLHEHHASDELIASLKKIIETHPGRTPICFCLECATGEKIFLDAESRYHVNPSLELAHALEELVGTDQVFVASQSKPLKNPIKERRYDAVKK